MLSSLRLLAIALVALFAACTVNTNDINPDDGLTEVHIEDIAAECEGLFVEITIIQGDLVVGPFGATAENGQIHHTVSEGNVGGQRADADLNPNLPIEIEIRIIIISKDCERLIEERLGQDITAGGNGTVLTSGYITGSGGVWSRDLSNFTVDSDPH